MSRIWGRGLGSFEATDFFTQNFPEKQKAPAAPLEILRLRKQDEEGAAHRTTNKQAPVSEREAGERQQRRQQ
jgi:hypothetical protein